MSFTLLQSKMGVILKAEKLDIKESKVTIKLYRA